MHVQPAGAERWSLRTLKALEAARASSSKSRAQTPHRLERGAPWDRVRHQPYQLWTAQPSENEAMWHRQGMPRVGVPDSLPCV